MKTRSTSGIILRRTNYAEADKIITFLTKDYGKTRAIAKGVRRAKSKMAGGVELFSVSEIHFIKGKGDIDTLVSTRIITHYDQIVKDLSRIDLAYEMLKNVDDIIEDSMGQEYFTVLNESFSSLNNEKVNLKLVRSSFLMRVLQLLGHIPDFTTDKYGKALNMESKFRFEQESRSFTADEKGSFDKNHIKVLKLLSFNPPSAMMQIQGIDNYLVDLNQLIENMYLQSR